MEFEAAKSRGIWVGDAAIYIVSMDSERDLLECSIFP